MGGMRSSCEQKLDFGLRCPVDRDATVFVRDGDANLCSGCPRSSGEDLLLLCCYSAACPQSLWMVGWAHAPDDEGMLSTSTHKDFNILFLSIKKSIGLYGKISFCNKFFLGKFP